MNFLFQTLGQWFKVSDDLVPSGTVEIKSTASLVVMCSITIRSWGSFLTRGSSTVSMNTLSRSKISTEESATSPWTCRVTTSIYLQNGTHMWSPEGLANKWWWYSTRYTEATAACGTWNVTSFQKLSHEYKSPLMRTESSHETLPHAHWSTLIPRLALFFPLIGKDCPIHRTQSKAKFHQ